MSSIKRKIRHFHVVVAQWWLRNARAKLLLCLTNLFLFLAFSLPSPSSLLKLPEQSNLPKATTQNAKAYENRTRVGLLRKLVREGNFWYQIYYISYVLYVLFHVVTEVPRMVFGRDPFNQNFRKFRSKTQWIGSVQPEKFRKNWSTFWGGPLFPVGPVGILVEWIAPSVWVVKDIKQTKRPCLAWEVVYKRLKIMQNVCFSSILTTTSLLRSLHVKMMTNYLSMDIPRAGIYYTASRLPSRRSTGAPYTKWIADLEIRHKEHNDPQPFNNNTINSTQ